jgi:hypothetical protein
MFELDYDTKYISVIIEFDYHSSESKNIPSDLRQAFLGIGGPKHPKNRGDPLFPTVIKERCKYEREIIFPIHWALIKKPIRFYLGDKEERKKEGKGESYRWRNTAVGAVILYKYLGLSKDFKMCCNEIKNLIKEKKDAGKPAYFVPITDDIKIIVGYDLNDDSK